MKGPGEPGGPLWAIVGSTGTGKSALATEVARAVGGEILSVDSAQVFIGLDIGTAKPTAAERREVPHHLIDVIDPDTQWTSAAFASAAEQAIADIRARGRVPILCGGTGLWLRALTRGLFDAPPIDPALREEIRARLAAGGSEALHAELAALDPIAAARLHPRDRQRIARALEVVRQTGRPISEYQREHGFREERHALRAVALDWPRDRLIARLAERTRAMYRAGLVDEVRRVMAGGASSAGPGLSCIGYREAVRHLAGELDLEATIDATIIATRQYAKRQRNWFNGEPAVVWLRPEARAEEAIAAWSREPAGGG
ncbi:MAG: tRNA (adenosine(37)-N6)-dimethylallyltransferase MiaA [Deltaproteobacteria bacterium]|nr:tRNA (adenosine(37)-N6)-dimethylallyltransferase MiaA [Deltaproteobacteria bacterium]